MLDEETSQTVLAYLIFAMEMADTPKELEQWFELNRKSLKLMNEPHIESLRQSYRLKRQQLQKDNA